MKFTSTIFRKTKMAIGKLKHPSEKYSFIKKLSDGSASKIYLAKNNITECKVIIKRIHKTEEWKDELKILNLISNIENKRLLEILDSYETDRFVYLITKYYDGFDLFDHIDVNVPYDIEYGKKLIREMTKCIKVCHDNGIVHLDIKCENFMFRDNIIEPYPKLVLIDFGHAEKINENELKIGYSKYGTGLYLCPEGFTRVYSTKSDIWSLGVCAHLILTGDYPFGGNDREYRRSVKSDDKDIDDKLSSEAHSFIENCLQYDPENRPTINDLLNSSFLRQ